MIKEIKDRWVEALRSNKYKQGTGQLCLESKEYCCLGVLCETLNIGKEEDSYIIDDIRFSDTLPASFLSELDLTVKDQDVLVSMNDASMNSFSEIADYIEKEL